MVVEPRQKPYASREPNETLQETLDYKPNTDSDVESFSQYRGDKPTPHKKGLYLSSESSNSED